MVSAIKLTRAKQRFTGPRVAATVAKLQAKSAPVSPTRQARRGLTVTKGRCAGLDTWTIGPSAAASGRIVVAIHGGAYTGEIASVHWALYAAMSRQTGSTFIVPIYPLAPTGTASKVVPQIADLVQTVIADHDSARVGVIGDSAGGGLALASMQELVARGAAVPARMILISPWLDATISDPASPHIDDPVLDVDGLRICGRMWAGDLDPGDTRVSPLFGSLDGLPATAVYSGSRDLLYPDTERLQERAKVEGLDMSFTHLPGLIHLWAALPFVPEVKTALAAVTHDLMKLSPTT